MEDEGEDVEAILCVISLIIACLFVFFFKDILADLFNFFISLLK